MENKIIQGDCLIEMQKLEDKSIDMVLCDLLLLCRYDTMVV